MKRFASGESVDVSSDEDIATNCFGCFTIGNNSHREQRRPASVGPETEATLIEEWNQLTVQEREQVQEEVHGVASRDIEETPELVQKCLEAMEDEIRKVRKRNAYDRALFLSPKYVKDPAFWLAFLRADSFNPRGAANRIVRFFEFKQELFGIGKLVKPITMDDLSTEDREVLMEGPCQFLPRKDRSGRTVMCVYGRCRKALNQMRVSFYEFMTQLQDVETQRKGVVAVWYNFSYDARLEPELMMKSIKFMQSVPWRTVGVHYCSTDPNAGAFAAFVHFALGRAGRLRFRAHSGSHLECQYALLSFGISMADFPVDTEGKLRLDRYRKSLEVRKQKELLEGNLLSNANGNGRIHAPSPVDVLCGRGKPFQEHSGNIDLAATIEELHTQYKATKRGRKADICEEIVRMIKQSNGRFVKRVESTGEWEEVPDDEAREKVSQGFRNMFRKHVTAAEELEVSAPSPIITFDRKRLKLIS